MIEPSTPSEAYEAIIDRLVDETRHYGAATSITDRRIYSNAPDHAPYNAFIRSLSSEQRELLSQMLRETRSAAIHDVLSDLTWWVTTRDVGMTFRGEPMPLDRSGFGLHGDYAGRCQGFEWVRS